MKSEPLEDSFTDILNKAQRGLKVSSNALPILPARPDALLKEPSAKKDREWSEEMFSLRKPGSRAGTLHESDLRTLAVALHLEPDRLLAISRGDYQPQAGLLPKEFVRFQTDFDGMSVNSYLVWDSTTRQAMAFDTGADASELLDDLTTNHLRLELLLLTHSHGDHIFDLDRIVEKTGATPWIAENLSGAHVFTPGKTFSLGGLKVETRLTNGHSSAGITYVIHGLSRCVAVVGDALFAGSIGGAHISYPDALHTCTSEILSLPDDTLLCPGHGPLTTVGQEKSSNPFFP